MPTAAAHLRIPMSQIPQATCRQRASCSRRYSPYWTHRTDSDATTAAVYVAHDFHRAGVRPVCSLVRCCLAGDPAIRVRRGVELEVLGGLGSIALMRRGKELSHASKTSNDEASALLTTSKEKEKKTLCSILLLLRAGSFVLVNYTGGFSYVSEYRGFR